MTEAAIARAPACRRPSGWVLWWLVIGWPSMTGTRVHVFCVEAPSGAFCRVTHLIASSF